MPIYKGNDKIRYIEKEGFACNVYQGNDLIHKNPSYAIGNPVMTSNNRPTPYVAYTNSQYSTADIYAPWNVFGINNRSWRSADGAFSGGIPTGDMPYIWLDLGSANAKRFCKMEYLALPSSYVATTPETLIIGWSNDNAHYDYISISGITADKWMNEGPRLTFYFEAPAVAQRYWFFSIFRINGGTFAACEDLNLYTDVNN
jgi:hypothetical protein